LAENVQVNLTLNKRKTLVGAQRGKGKVTQGEGKAQLSKDGMVWDGTGWLILTPALVSFSELCRVPTNSAMACDEELETMRKTATACKVTTALVQRD